MAITIGDLVEGSTAIIQLIGKDEYEKNKDLFKKNFKAKIKSITLEELRDALKVLAELPFIQDNPVLNISINALITSITAYIAAIAIYSTIQKVIPIVKAAAKSSAVPLNPGMAGEIAQDAALAAQKFAMQLAETAIEEAKEALFAIEIPGTENL